MIKYNLKYEANGKIIEKRNLSEKEMKEFLDTLEKQQESSLRVTKVNDMER